MLGGVRDLDPFERRLIDEGVVRHVPVGPNMLTDIDAAVGDRPVYVHLDCDVLEPGLVLPTIASPMASPSMNWAVQQCV